MISLKELKEIVKVMHSQGIVSFKTPELELLIQPKPIVKRRRKADPMTDNPISTNNNYKGYTDEEVLAWSATNSEG